MSMKRKNKSLQTDLRRKSDTLAVLVSVSVSVLIRSRGDAC